MIKNAIPAHQRFPSVRYQTIKATIAAGISMKSRRIMKIIIKPSMIKPMSPKMSYPKKLNFNPLETVYSLKGIIIFCA